MSIRNFLLTTILSSLFIAIPVFADLPTHSVADNSYIIQTTYYVSPDGNDQNLGTTKSTPKKTIKAALSLAQPGDRVYLLPGDFYEDIKTVRDGEADAPIQIQGSKNAILHGKSSSRVVQIFHNHIHLRGFIIDGLTGDGAIKENYKDILVWVQGTEPMQGPQGFVARAMYFRNAGGECMRLRYFVTQAEIFSNTFYNCGVYDFRFKAGSKNGEAIYIGTAPEQWANGKNPTADADESSYNWIHDNKIRTNGNECVDIKEGSSFNLVENNRCLKQKDSHSAGFDSRGDNNTFRYNESYSNNGAGVRLGGDVVNGRQYGIGNEVYGNILHDNGHAGVKVMAAPQAKICDNTLYNNAKGDFYGANGAYYAPAQSCN
ncbi:MAG: right-handed parallel beta-helix repeat-containing protein [Hahellaceae bacterium]|nr:right-handed parallel beta-helix repeat-containing protein [Hahellaceae bacterium]MCP5169169.1 right-handed parallel beta-helix repeat-containing protein [Hahellaceae bacterium]